jgi:hypothetical protein
MQAVIDLVDLLQLQEIWVRLPITRAYSRLERRHTSLDCPLDFSLKGLMPRLGQLRHSAVWRTKPTPQPNDPAQLPICALTDDYLDVLYPAHESPEATRQNMFISAYNHFVMARYSGAVDQVCGLLRTLAEVCAEAYCLTADDVPVEGSSFWIPVDLTDEIRALDERYDSAEAETPATYVVADDFWNFLVKAEAQDIQAAAAQYCTAHEGLCVADGVAQLTNLVTLARDWNRSSSVVGLYYQRSAL